MLFLTQYVLRNISFRSKANGMLIFVFYELPTFIYNLPEWDKKYP